MSIQIFHACLRRVVNTKHYELFPGDKLNVLRSHGIPTNEESYFLMTRRDTVGGLGHDSGVFTLQNDKSSNIEMVFNRYVDYLLRVGHLFNFYFNYDLDFTKNGYATNIGYQERLEEAGLHPVPVIHDLYGDEVDYYIDKGYQMVAIGSNEGKNYNELWPIVDKLYRKGIKIHLFGTTRWELISTLPISSCDSSNGNQIGAFGDIKYWNPKKQGNNKTDIIYLEEYLRPGPQRGITLSTYEFREDLERYLWENFHITTDHLVGYEKELYKQLVNVHHLVEIQHEINKIHRIKGYWM